MTSGHAGVEVRRGLRAAGVEVSDDVAAAVAEHLALLRAYADELDAAPDEQPEPAAVFRA